MNKENFKAICVIMLQDLGKVLKVKGISLAYDNKAVNLLVEKSFSEKYGARNMRRYIEKNT